MIADAMLETAPPRRRLADLCVRHQASLYRTCLGVLRRSDLAEDAVQQTFLAVLRGGDGQREAGREQGWLHRVAVNAALQLLRAERRRVRHERASLETGFPGSASAPPADPDAREIWQAVHDLPARWRMPVLLRFQEGMSYREIAGALDCPQGTVAFRVHEALERLRELLGRNRAPLTAAAMESLLGAMPPAPVPHGLPAKLHEVLRRAAPARLVGPAAAALGATRIAILAKEAVATAFAVGLAVAAWVATHPPEVGDSRAVVASLQTERIAVPAPAVADPAGPGADPSPEEPVAGDPAPRDPKPSSEAAHPPYPWAISPAAAALRPALARDVSIAFTDATLTEVMAELSRLGEIPFRTGDRVDPARLRITIRVESLALEHVIGLVSRMHNLRYVVSDDGAIVFVPLDAPIGLPPAWEALGHLAQAQASPAAEESLERTWAEEETQARNRLRAVLVQEDLVQELTALAVHKLTEGTGIEVGVDTAYLAGLEEMPEVNVPRGRTLDEALAAVAEQSGLELLWFYGAPRLVAPEQAAQSRAARQQRLEAAEESLGRRITFPPGALAGHEFGAQIEDRTGVHVMVAEGLWNRPEPLTLPEGDRTLRAALDYVCALAGLHWRLIDGTIYVF